MMARSERTNMTMVRERRFAGSRGPSSGTSGGVVEVPRELVMAGADSRRARGACQALVLLAVLALGGAACGGDAAGTEVRQAIKLLARLETTCTGYAGPNAHKLLNAMILEAVRLYEEANYEPALDSILRGYAMCPEGASRTYYGFKQGVVEVALRWPTKDEEPLAGLDPRKWTWVMVAVANLSGARMELGGLRASVERDGRPVKDAGGNDVQSVAPDDVELKRLLGPKAGELAPAAVNQAETVTFVVVFPAFERWTDIRFEHEAYRLDVRVRNYPDMSGNLGKYLEARKLAAGYREKAAKVKPTPTAEPRPEPQPVRPRAEYILIGYIQNVITAGQSQYGIKLVDRKLAREHKTFYVRREESDVAELRPIGTGTIAELVSSGYKPVAGDGVYVRAVRR